MRRGKCSHQEVPDTVCLWIAARVFAPDCKGVPGCGALQNGGASCGHFARIPQFDPAMLRLFWRLVLATKQTIGHILEWSAWRRWHQGMAQFYHYKRRAGPEVQL